MPVISIIVPVYNVEKLLCRCIDSILCQSFENFEVILVDDGSPDNSGDICDHYANLDSRVRVIHKENKGVSSARNAGIDVSCGEFLCFVDSDDLIHPQMLQFLLDSLLAHNADISTTRYIAFTADTVHPATIDNVKETLLTRQDFLEHLYPDHFEQIGISAWGKLYRRELFDELRYPEGRIYEDLHIYLKLLMRCHRIVVLDKPLYYYYLGNISITKSSYLAHCRFDEFSVRLTYANYFRSNGLQSQCRYAINDYLTFFFRNAFAILLKYPEMKEDFAVHMKTNKELLPYVIFNKHVCRARKLCAVLIHVHPATAAAIARQCIPECLLEDMR